MDLELRAYPDRVEPPVGAGMKLATASPVRQRQWPTRTLGAQPIKVVGMPIQPAPQDILQPMQLVRPDKQIIARGAVEDPPPGMLMRPGLLEVDGINQRGVGIGSERGRARERRQPTGEPDRLLRFLLEPGHARWCVVAGQVHDMPGQRPRRDQQTLREWNILQQLQGARRGGAPSDRDPAAAHRPVIRLCLPQVNGAVQPVHPGELAESVNRPAVGLLQQDHIGPGNEPGEELTLPACSLPDPVSDIPTHEPKRPPNDDAPPP